MLAAVLPVGSEARLVLDVERRDQYGRLVADVYRADGGTVNAMMVGAVILAVGSLLQLLGEGGS